MCVSVCSVNQWEKATIHLKTTVVAAREVSVELFRNHCQNVEVAHGELFFLMEKIFFTLPLTYSGKCLIYRLALLVVALSYWWSDWTNLDRWFCPVTSLFLKQFLAAPFQMCHKPSGTLRWESWIRCLHVQHIIDIYPKTTMTRIIRFM